VLLYHFIYEKRKKGSARTLCVLRVKKIGKERLSKVQFLEEAFGCVLFLPPLLHFRKKKLFLRRTGRHFFSSGQIFFWKNLWFMARSFVSSCSDYLVSFSW